MGRILIWDQVPARSPQFPRKTWTPVPCRGGPHGPIVGCPSCDDQEMRVNDANFLGGRDKSSKRDWHPSRFHENKPIGREPTSGDRHLLQARRTEGHAVLLAAMLSAVLRSPFPPGGLTSWRSSYCSARVTESAHVLEASGRSDLGGRRRITPAAAISRGTGVPRKSSSLQYSTARVAGEDTPGRSGKECNTRGLYLTRP